VSTDVPDGATQRHSRLMELLAFINLYGKASTTQMQSHMVTTFGLKFKTTSDMIRELATAGMIKEDGHGFWYLKETQQKAFKRLRAQEKTDNLVDPLTRRIDKIKDDKTRRRLEKLASQLHTTLLEAEQEETENPS
jgi:uncharacterized protein YwgA